jgi:hypothetical protein
LGATHPYAVFHRSISLRKYFSFRQEQYPMLPTSVYGNKIVGYEDAMRTITQEMVVMRRKED